MSDDSAPILAPHLEEQKTLPDKVNPKPKTEEQLLKEKFAEAKKNIISLEYRHEWKELIKGTDCFISLWKDPETGEYCEHLDCDLRQLCQTTWVSVAGGLAKDEKIDAAWRYHRRKDHSEWKEKQKKKRKSTRGRCPYVDTGRPVDRFAGAIWELLQPLDLPENYIYPKGKNRRQRTDAKNLFIVQHGDGVFVSRVTSYHQYYYRGVKLLRMWVSSNSGGWLDCSEKLANELAKLGSVDLVETPKNKNKFKFYPFRIHVRNNRTVEKIKTALRNFVEGLEEEDGEEV